LAIPFVLMACIGCVGIRPDCYAARWSAAPAHMTNAIKEPFVVRRIQGKLIPTFTEAWPSDAGPFPVVFEISGSGGETIVVAVASDGSFNFAAPEGTYCFRVSSDLLQGYEGTIIVTRSAPEGSKININIAMGA
jgi:hypothetical protein